MTFNFKRKKQIHVVAAFICCISIVLLSSSKSYSNQTRRIWARCAAGDETAIWVSAKIWIWTKEDGWKKIYKNAYTKPPVPTFMVEGNYNSTIYVRGEGAKYTWGGKSTIQGKGYSKFDISNLGNDILIEFSKNGTVVRKRPGKRTLVLENRSVKMDRWEASFATGYKSDGKWYSEGWYNVTPSNPIYYYLPDGMDNIFCFVKSGSEYQVIDSAENESFYLDPYENFWLELTGGSSANLKMNFWRAAYQPLKDDNGKADGGYYHCSANDYFNWEYYNWGNDPSPIDIDPE